MVMDLADGSLDAGVAAPMFNHAPLDQFGGFIRLIQMLPGSCEEPIRCELIHAPISKVNYVAFSYEWGSSKKRHCIEINAGQFYVTTNLYDFLTAARKSLGNTRVWIDAICIDQTNIPERNDQVKRMGQIYSMAKQVWVWLGRPLVTLSGPSFVEMFDLSTETGVRDPRRTGLKLQRWRREKNEEWHRKLIHICNQGYWTRLWVTQEFLKARSIVIWIGDDQFPGKDFWSLIAGSLNPYYVYPAHWVRKRIQESGAYALYQLRTSLLQESDDESSEESDGVQVLRPLERPLHEVLFQHCSKDCSDWHDKVYGILSFVREGDRFPIDYSTNKVDLLMAVIRFQATVDWSLTWSAGLVLTEVLDIPDTALLRYSRQCQGVDATKEWKSLHLYRVETRSDNFLPDSPKPSSSDRPKSQHSPNIRPGAGPIEPDSLRRIYHPSLFDTGLMAGSEWMAQHEKEHEEEHEDCQTMNIEECQCHFCTSMALPFLVPGDKIYEIQGDDHEPGLGTEPVLALRPSLDMKYGYRLLGSIRSTSHGGYVLLHALPQLDAPYNLEDHLRHDPEDNTRLLLDLDPPTLCFFIRTLVHRSFANVVTKDPDSNSCSHGDMEWMVRDRGRPLAKGWSDGLTRLELQKYAIDSRSKHYQAFLRIGAKRKHY